ncbi:MAG: VCBS repeat-containing protein [Verrucomicrobia bacterium]|nr:VCBS repeat-containing protein [Verrucomicrobiota bacterium]
MNEDPGHKNNPEEYGDVDDRVIGKAIRISLILLGVLVVGFLTIVYLLNRDEAELGEARTAVEVPVERVEDDEKTPVVTFVDISQGSGIHFTHNSGARGDKLLPESMGGGVMVMDFDGDGMEDLYFVNSTWWKEDMGEATDLKATTGSLYRNISKQGGEIQFEEWTDRAGLRDIVYGMGGAVGDIDNDGDPDIYVTCVGENRLYVNRGDGTFQESSGQWGVEGAEGDWSTAAAFFDYDRDGWLDLFVANYVQWSREIDFKVNFTIDGKHRAYGPPTDFEGAFPRLYRNMAGQGFLEVSETAGVQVQNRATGRPASKSLGLVVYDFNTDGWPDIMVANDTVANLLLLNQGDGTFKEVGAVTGVAYDANGNTRGAMGDRCGTFPE